MKRSFKIGLVALVILLVSSLGLNMVFAVSGAEPGSDQDPIVSKSYVDAAVSQLTTAMQKLQEQIDALKTENAQQAAKITSQEQANKALQDELKALKADIASGKVTSGNTGSSGSTGGSTNTGTNPAATSIGKGTVNTEILNIRQQANTTSAIAGKVPKGETLTLVSKSGDWYKVKTSKGITGYVMAKFITVKK